MENKQHPKKAETSIIVQMGIFAGILFISYLISALFPQNFPVPAPVVGLVILYLLLTFKIIKPEQVEKLSSFLIGILAFLFVPSGIQLATSLNIMKHSGVQLVIMIIISTIVMLVSVALVATFLIWLRNKLFGKKDELK